MKNLKLLKLHETAHLDQANQLLRCGGWSLLDTGFDHARKATMFILGQYRPFICPLCGELLRTNQVTIDFVLGHRIACKCYGNAPKLLLEERLDDYFAQ